ncbi:MAG: radical SAM family heme chaperone HemW [Gammaproteobacteria bacterium]|nr:radical SAM family heme chaperone HemW [Gammaproteobacteria bacterium]
MTGLYIHIPWCERKCPYCDFNSHVRPDTINEEQYISRLVEDFQNEKSLTEFDVSSVYIGGGTPSLFHAESYRALFTGLGIGYDNEITLEANPGTIERDDFASYQSVGINRVSIGVQSFDPEHLRALGRIHSSQEAKDAIEQATRSGIQAINIDLMFGLPNQSIEQALHDLNMAIALDPTHISWYQLTIEPNTVFGRRPPLLTSDDYRAEMSERGIDLLAKQGYERYEVSAFAREGQVCKHNVNYWEFGDYIGIGAGAHGKLTTPNGIQRTRKPKQPDSYLRNSKRMVSEIATEDLSVEFMMNALRLKNGVPKQLFTQRTGLCSSVIEETISELVAEGVMQPDRLALTEFGYRHLDFAVGRFLHLDE